MKPKDKEKITQVVKEVYLDSYCIKIDSALLTAQSRKRFYWSNIPYISLPLDKYLSIKDILEYKPVGERSYYYDVDGFKKEMEGSYSGKHGSFKECLLPTCNEFYTYDYECGDENFDEQKYPRESESRPNQGYKVDLTEKKNKTRANRYRIEHIRGTSQKSRCLGTGCLSIANTSGTGVFVNGVYRSLTIGECERLQGLPTDFTKFSKDKNGKISNSRSTHRARAVGNGFTIPVISHILSFIPEIRSGEWK